jgi:dTMP kinase
MGAFIAIEGADANGKATQSKILAEKLDAVLYSFPRYDIPPLGPAIRRHLEGEISTFQWEEPLDRWQKGAPEDVLIFQSMMTVEKYHAAATINRELDSRHVIADRWTPSAEIYGWSDGLDAEWLRDIQLLLPKPDLLIYLEVSMEEALRRRPKLRDRYEKDPERQSLVRRLYRQIWERHPIHSYDIAKPRYVIVDGEGSIEEVSQRIFVEVERCLSCLS